MCVTYRILRVSAYIAHFVSIPFYVTTTRVQNTKRYNIYSPRWRASKNFSLYSFFVFSTLVWRADTPLSCKKVCDAHTHICKKKKMKKNWARERKSKLKKNNGNGTGFSGSTHSFLLLCVYVGPSDLSLTREFFFYFWIFTKDMVFGRRVQPKKVLIILLFFERNKSLGVEPRVVLTLRFAASIVSKAQKKMLRFFFGFCFLLG